MSHGLQPAGEPESRAPKEPPHDRLRRKINHLARQALTHPALHPEACEGTEETEKRIVLTNALLSITEQFIEDQVALTDEESAQLACRLLLGIAEQTRIIPIRFIDRN